MRYLGDFEIAAARLQLSRAIGLARKSNCEDAQLGAVIFSDGKVLGEGYNHIPQILSKEYSCKSCPRRKSELHKGVGLELCIAIHAEEDAINDMLINRSHKIADSKGSKMIVARIKEGEVKIPRSVNPYCTKCSGKIATQTEIDEIIFQVKDGFVAFKKSEFHIKSINNLYQNWTDQIFEGKK